MIQISQRARGREAEHDGGDAVLDGARGCEQEALREEGRHLVRNYITITCGKVSHRSADPSPLSFNHEDGYIVTLLEIDQNTVNYSL